MPLTNTLVKDALTDLEELAPKLPIVQLALEHRSTCPNIPDLEFFAALSVALAKCYLFAKMALAEHRADWKETDAVREHSQGLKPPRA